MPVEIERKYLVKSETWREKALDRRIFDQAYFSCHPTLAVRVRIAGSSAWLTLKGRKVGDAAPEFDYSIPAAHAREMMKKLPIAGRLKKIRWRVRERGRIWEVDEFLEDNAGLVLAEIELKRATDQPVLPEWAGREVTDDPRYANSNLAQHPYARWRRKPRSSSITRPN